MNPVILIGAGLAATGAAAFACYKMLSKEEKDSTDDAGTTTNDDVSTSTLCDGTPWSPKDTMRVYNETYVQD